MLLFYSLTKFRQAATNPGLRFDGVELATIVPIGTMSVRSAVMPSPPRQDSQF
jgi:hypothetical protein